MFWSSPNRHRRRDGDSGDMTVGQKIDTAELTVDPIQIAMHGGNPFGKATWKDVRASVGSMTQVGVGLDLAISTAHARRGQAVQQGAGALAAQAAGIGGYWAGRGLGAAIGGTVLPIFGAPIGAFVGGAVATLAGDKIARRTVIRGINRLTRGTYIDFGNTYKDSLPAYTMRQEAERQLQGSLVNAQRYLGTEARLMHQ